jgi:hypothetical protein
MAKKCKCQDTNSDICGKVMTKQEFKQDGMCQFCADNVWAEMRSTTYKWYHRNNT